MHDDVSVHLDDLYSSDGLGVVPPGGPGASVHADVVQLTVLFDHFDAGIADVRYGHFDRVAKVFGPLEPHDACRPPQRRECLLLPQFDKNGRNLKIYNAKAKSDLTWVCETCKGNLSPTIYI